jgi:AcrR family transcriptional regulator
MMKVKFVLSLIRNGEEKMARITKPVEERRQEIIDTARKLFIENGFDKTAVADISKEMNVANGLVYHYFKSKTEMLYAVIDEIAAEISNAKQKTVSEHQGTALECLGMFLMHEIDIKRYGKLFSNLINDQGIMEYVSKNMISSIAPILVTLLNRGNQDGSWNCPYPKETASFILQGGSGFIMNQEEMDETQRQIYKNIIMRVLGISDDN